MSLSDYKHLVLTIGIVSWSFFGVVLFIYLLAQYGILGLGMICLVIILTLIVAERIEPRLKR